MSVELTSDQQAAVTMLLRTGKSIKDIAKFADLDSQAIRSTARELDLEPATPAQRRGKQLFQSPDGLTYQEIAQRLAHEGFSTDDAPMHHLTVASWVRNMGWAWGGAPDGEYAPDSAARPAARSKYVLRLSKSVDAEVNSSERVSAAAAFAWQQLASDKTCIVQQAVIAGAAETGVTNLVAIKKALLETRGDEIRNTKEG